MLSVFAFNDKSEGKCGVILFYTILLYIASLFFKSIPAITNFIMVCIFFLAWFNISPKQYLKHFSNHPINIGIIIFFLFQIISLLYSTDKHSGIDVLQRRLPLFILPIAFCLIDFEKKTWNKILLFYAFATTLASVIGFVNGSYLAITEHDNGYLYNDNISSFILGKQSVYFSFYVNIAVFVFIYLLLQKEDIVKKIRFYIWLFILWLLFISYMLACKTAMISLLIILLWTVLSYLIRKRKFFEIAIISVTLIVGIFLAAKISPKTINRFNGLTQTDFQFDNKNKENHFNAEYDKSKWGSTNTRIAIWTCGFEVWKEHVIFGTGIGDRNTALYKKYKEKQFWYALTTEKNTHNQYLDVIVSMGTLGLCVFLFVFFVYPFKLFLKHRQGLAISVFICLAICFLTENMLDRYQGEVLIAFILPLVSKIKDDEKVLATDFLKGTC